MSAHLSIKCGGNGQLSVALASAPVRTMLTNLDIHLIYTAYSFNNVGDSQARTPAIPMTRWDTDSTTSWFVNNNNIQCAAMTKRNIMLSADGGESTPFIVTQFPFLMSFHSYCRIYSMKVTSYYEPVVFSQPIDGNTFNDHTFNLDFDPDRPLVITVVHSQIERTSMYYFNNFPDRQSAKEWAELFYHTKCSCSPTSSGPGYDIRASS